MSRFGIQAIKLNGTQYPGVMGYQATRGWEFQSEGSDGVVNESAHHLTRRRPLAELQTLSLKAIVAALNDGTDFPVKAFDGVNGLVMYGAKQAANAVGFAGGSVHQTRTGLSGLIYASGLRWSPGPTGAVLALRGMFTSSNGQTEAISEGTAALPTQPVPDFRFTLSSCQINGSTINAIDSLEVGIDPKFEYEYSAGLPDPVLISGAGVRGKLAITARAEIGDIDLGEGTGAVSFVFTRFQSGGGFGTDSLTLTLNGALSVEEGLGGENGRDMKRSLLIRTLYNGSTKPLTWSLT